MLSLGFCKSFLSVNSTSRSFLRVDGWWVEPQMEPEPQMDPGKGWSCLA